MRILHRFAVRGSGRFPVDMLRYDEVFPYDQKSAAKIAISEHSKRIIHLAAWHPKGWKPTEKRWQSFLWNVIKTDPSNPLI